MSRILPIAEVLARTSLSRRTLYNEISAGRFPRQIQISARRVGWREDEIEAWQKQRQVAAGSGDNSRAA